MAWLDLIIILDIAIISKPDGCGWVGLRNLKWYITSQEGAVESFHDWMRTLHNNGWELLCVDKPTASARRAERSEASLADAVGESTQRRSKPLLCNVRLRSWKLETDFSWLRIWLSLVWIKFYCKGGHFKIWKFILTMKTNLTRPCKLVFGSGWI